MAGSNPSLFFQEGRAVNLRRKVEQLGIFLFAREGTGATST
jgi:hypothetical protein